MTTNGQSPFVTIFLNLKKDDPYIKENAMVIEEIIRQRYEGIKNEKGVYVTPAFPKLIYVLDDHNCLKGGEYDYLVQWDAEVSYHHGKMKMETTNLKEDLIKVLLVSTYLKLVLLQMEMKKNSGNY